MNAERRLGSAGTAAGCLPDDRAAGNGNLDHVQAEQQIFTESSAAHLFFQVAIGCCDNPDIGASRLIFTDALKFPFLAESAAAWLAGWARSR